MTPSIAEIREIEQRQEALVHAWLLKKQQEREQITPRKDGHARSTDYRR